MTLSLKDNPMRAAGEELLSWFRNELDNSGKHWKLDEKELVDWRVGDDFIELELSDGGHIRVLFEAW
jgi:hypothetical protein